MILNDRRHLLGAMYKLGVITVGGATLLLYPVIFTRSTLLTWMFACNLLAFAAAPTTFAVYGIYAKRHVVKITADRRCGKCHAATRLGQARCVSCGSWFKW